jgi:hypothetical protein
LNRPRIGGLLAAPEVILLASRGKLFSVNFSKGAEPADSGATNIVIRSEATEFRYEHARQPLSRIDPCREQLDGLLLANAEKPTRERLTLIRIFEELRALGYEGSYDAV